MSSINIVLIKHISVLARGVEALNCTPFAMTSIIDNCIQLSENWLVHGE